MSEEEKQALWPVVAFALALVALAFLISAIATILAIAGACVFYSANEALKRMRDEAARRGDESQQ